MRRRNHKRSVTENGAAIDLVRRRLALVDQSAATSGAFIGSRTGISAGGLQPLILFPSTVVEMRAWIPERQDRVHEE
jgi:hypothetical protein